jgi:hypothetical protein
VQEASLRFGDGIAGESDVSQAIALVIGRAAGSAGHSFVSTIDQLRHFSDDLMTLTDVSRSADQMRSAVTLIRRFRKDGVIVQSQAGRLFELQEVAAALRMKPNTVISFNQLTPGAATDIDLLLDGKAVELKYTLNSVSGKDIITKFFKYHATTKPGTLLELRSLDDASTMTKFVNDAFETYENMVQDDWPLWLKNLAPSEEQLTNVKNAISCVRVEIDAAKPRYNFFAAAG